MIENSKYTEIFTESQHLVEVDNIWFIEWTHEWELKFLK